MGLLDVKVVNLFWYGYDGGNLYLVVWFGGVCWGVDSVVLVCFIYDVKCVLVFWLFKIIIFILLFIELWGCVEVFDGYE